MKSGEYRGINYFTTRTDDKYRSYVLIDGEARQCQHEPVDYPEIAVGHALNYIDGFLAG